MIRIDENTHIDDTLVTCAEYQLFIDEMREQGIFFQPDHWTSYQFPENMARALIVGVRFSDAKTFCSWLTQREAGEWSYRIPTSAEVKRYVLANPIQSPLGYWIIGEDSKAQFTWVDPTPFNPRDIDPNFARALDSVRARDLDRDIAVARVLDSDLDIDFVRAFASTRDLNHARAFASTITRALNLNQARDHDLANAFDIILDFARDIANAMNLDRAIDSARILDSTIAADLESAFARDLNTAHNLNPARERAHDLAIAIDHDLDSAIVSALAHTRDRDFARARNIAHDLALALDLFLDILTLQERIAGRLPAFEGIRIVKKRKP
jgi:hypothetical protein